MIIVKKKMLCKTTTFGHALRVGGILYFQTATHEDFKERQKIIESMANFYPISHFVLVDSRRTPWTRQFLLLKVINSVE